MSRGDLFRGLTALLILFVTLSEFVSRREHEAHVEHSMKHRLATAVSVSDDEHKHLPLMQNIGAGV